MEFEETCLAGEDSSDEEVVKIKAAKLMFCTGHCDQLVSRSTFYRHQSELRTATVDSEEEEFDSISEMRCPSESYFDEALPVLELQPTDHERDAAHSVDEENDMDHSPSISSDSESVSIFLKRADFQNVLTCSCKIFGL